MSKIDELIDRLCPDGVEYRKIGSIFETFTGKTPKKSDKSLYGNEYPFYKPSDFDNGSTISKTDENLSKKGYDSLSKKVQRGSTLVVCVASLGKIGYALEEGACNQQINVISPCEGINSRFVFHYCCSKHFKIQMFNKANVSSMPILNLRNFNEIYMPVPPLEVQEEIVRVLDSFTELEAELEAELVRRKTQYVYYRDQLLSFSDKGRSSMSICSNKVEYKRLKDIACIKNGRDYKALGKGRVPVYGSGGPMGIYVDKAMHEGPSVLLPRKGSITNVFYVDGPIWNVDTVFYTEIDSTQIIPKFFYYLMQNVHIERFSTGGAARPSLTQSALNKIQIPVPPLEEQKRIVAILDKFDVLINDLTSGLPAEIEARRKQYEYYRDKLLSFPVKES